MNQLSDERLLDTTQPSIARTYDAILGGKDNYEADRAVVRELVKAVPTAPMIAKENRAWLVRAVRWMATAGIDQFLDCGAGLPTMENTHDVVKRVNPDATVLYVDNDPACQVYGRALLENTETKTFLIDADLTEVDALFEHHAVARHLDLSRPVALIHCGVLHHVPDAGDPWGIVARYRERLPSGSALALTHFHAPEDERLHRVAKDLEMAMANLGSGWFRSREEIQAFFGDWEMVPPGLVYLHEWWPTGPRVTGTGDADYLILGGVARKP
ncbi:S-adenosyl methyltransferase [Amycolatopsis arida]|uniref:S-adenosyl methyltransferase n=1 Tax=Amycolatopsis arida TaxID=587909 RepID=A0A1I5ZEC8_9PSEU|nr:SAM-dependent methyltransferase [Amycolatopsis arida]TDX89584.1 S-adenosyl methyltransferase [Amycolatopsis arida]SFQ54839.1 S-adenosyl methyltransferase [Amycolatopsis arida]